MHLKRILNRVEPLKSFVYRWIRIIEVDDAPTVIQVDIEPRANGRPTCSGCGKKGPTYDRRPVRRFQFVPLWNIAVFFVYAMRRVDCPRCGVTVEQVPWADGKSSLTTSYRWFLARWARRLSWKETAEAFGTSWDSVFRSVQHAVLWGLARRELKDIQAIGVDEIAWRKGQSYLTLVYRIDGNMKRLLWVAQDRTEQSLRGFFEFLSDEVRKGIRFVATDMCKAYLNVIAEQVPKAVNVLDRFHIMKNMNVAIDEVRRTEVAELKRDGYEPILKHSRWCLLKRRENPTDPQAAKLDELLTYNLKSVKAMLMREDFQQFWTYLRPSWAMKFLDSWCEQAKESGLEPMTKVAKSLQHHHRLLANWFRAKRAISSGVVEGFNGKSKLTIRKAYGLRTPEGIRIALFHTLGRLPVPEGTHRFC
jgi:transposase